MRNKRGLSNVVSTLLIVLLVIVAIGVIWFVIGGFIEEGASDISFSSITIDLKIMSATLSENGNDLSVVVRRNPGEGDVIGVNFILSSGDNSKVYEERRVLNVFDVFTFEISNYLSDVPGATEVSIAPIFNTEQGKEKLGDITDTEVFAEGTGGGGGDTGAVCGNNILEDGEQCDGGVGANGCTTIGLEFTDGDLNCFPAGHASECTFDTSLCTGGSCVTDETRDCPNQEGVCLGAQETCVSSAWPGCDASVYSANSGAYEDGTELLCEDGLDNDCDGAVDYDDTDCEQTWTGTVGTPWPTETKILFDIVETTSDFVTPTEIYVGKYMSFSGTSIETRCLQIFDYVTPSESQIYDKAIVRLDENPPQGFPINIVTGDTFTIWDTSQTCGV